MNQKVIKELIEFLVEKDIAEFEFTRGDMKVRVKRGSEAVGMHPDGRYFAVPSAPPPTPIPFGAAPVSAAERHATPSTETPAEAAENLHMVRSPIVGTYYESPSPGAPPFVKVGEVVEAGQVLCIVEAMKLMNEIESDVAGEIVKCLVNNNQPIEYGQELFAIRPRK
jgi:acetyl-CoA carboxylase biotin carboxyl carrier protein